MYLINHLLPFAGDDPGSSFKYNSYTGPAIDMSSVIVSMQVMRTLARNFGLKLIFHLFGFTSNGSVTALSLSSTTGILSYADRTLLKWNPSTCRVYIWPSTPTSSFFTANIPMSGYYLYYRTFSGSWPYIDSSVIYDNLNPNGTGIHASVISLYFLVGGMFP